MPEDVIVIRDLGKSYPKVEALRSVSLTVKRNSIYGFLGPDGAGKTTTMKILLGLIRPTSGSAHVLSKDVTRESVEIRSRIGYLPQDPRFYEHLSARQTVRFRAGLYFSGPRDGVEARVEECLELAGLADKADRPVRGFSGGERQRLGLAQAVVNDPDLLILDEPAANLDPIGRRDVLALIERLREKTTVFYSTHILDDVQRVSDTVAILDKGAVVAQGSIGELLSGGRQPSYRLAIRGDAGRARAAVAAQSWASSVDVVAEGKDSILTVAVTDVEAAEERLLRLVLEDPAVKVTQFGKSQEDLEQVFMRMVEGGEPHAL